MHARSVPPFEVARGGLLVSTDPARLDLDAVQRWLAGSYWSPGIPRETVRRAFEGSLGFGVYEGRRQLGVARVVSDGATFAWLCDVFVDEPARGQGLGTWLVECARAHPALQGLRRWLLATRDAHEVYRRLGFEPLARPEGWMEIAVPDIYLRAEAAG